MAHTRTQTKRILSVLMALIMIALSAPTMLTGAAENYGIYLTNPVTVGVGETVTIPYYTVPDSESLGFQINQLHHCSPRLQGKTFTVTGNSIGTDTFYITMSYNNETYRAEVIVNVTDNAPTTHTVTYNYSANGGTSATKTTATVAEGAAIDLTPTATKSGWTFVGWNTNSNATTALSSLSMGTSNVTLYAIYSKSATATYIDYSGTTKTTRTITGTFYNNENNVKVTHPAQNTLTGWTARGWTHLTTPDAEIGSAVYLDRDYTFYGTYQRTVTLTYNANGGSSTPASQSGIQYVNSYDVNTIKYPTVKLANAISRSGYTFAGWAAGSVDGQRFDAGTNVDLYNNTTVYATWATQTHTVTYNYSTNGGMSATKTTATVAEGAAIDLTPTATKSGWTFVGWNTNSSATTALSSLTMGTSNVTLYAIYKKIVTATFIDYNGTTKTTRTKTGTFYNNETSVTITAPMQNNRTGWTARGWTYLTTPDAEAGSAFWLSQDYTFYGLYQRTVTLTYNANGGSSTPASQSGIQYVNSYDVNTIKYPTVKLANAISRSGYTFAGWAAGSVDGQRFDAGTNVDLYNNTTVYATWATQTHTVTYNYSANGGTSATKTTATVAEGAAIDLTPTATKSGWTFVGWNTNSSATTALSSLTMGTSNVTLYAIFKQNVNIYNLGEETYSFKNYGDEHGSGHCHGMSLTSAGYYLGRLDPSAIGIGSAQYLNSVADNATSRNAICYYQHIQGNYTKAGVVAGTITYYHSGKTTTQCWNEVVNYVKSHQYDNKGTLQVQIWKTETSGHAVNFLYYKNVDGQDRVYVYDNNFPTQEVYFYLGSNGKVYQAPKSTYGTYVETICLVDVNKYYDAAGSYKANNYIYAKSGEVDIASATAYPMAGDEGMIMYEIPDDLNKVDITPLVDNATFEYIDSSYSFGEVDEYTSGVLTVVPDNVAPSAGMMDNLFTIVRDAPDPEPQNLCPWCGGEHVGFFAGIIGWFHSILAMIFGARY